MSGKTFIIRPKSRPPKPLDYSQYVAQRRNVGASSNVYDLVNGPPSKLDLAVIYSNGYRYQYLAFKATSFVPAGATGGCGIVTDYETELRPIIDGDGVDTGQTELVTENPRYLTFAYNGNAVVPQGPPNNTPTNSRPPPAKEHRVPRKIGC